MNLAKKSLGQNFLIDKNIIKKIISLVNIKDKDIIEIGPGRGALTDEILKKKPKSLVLIEKDYKLFEGLKNKFSDNKNIKIFNADILKFNLEKTINFKKSIIFGNLPYNISSQIFVKIIKFKKWLPNFDNLILMFQKELGEKIIGKYKSRNYSRLSILNDYRFEVINKFIVSQNCFSPKPKVLSIVIHFRPIKNIYNIKNVNNLEKITNIFFSNRRKMINKSIKKILSQKKIHMIKNLNLNSRPSDLNPELYYIITSLFEKE